MGIVDATKKGLGLEGAGTICCIGQDVKNLRVGDRVMVFATGSFSTRLITSAQLCAKIPDELSFEDAATMPCVYATAIYSLMDVGRLEKGQVRRLMNILCRSR
jgi:NADPH:quinone reductase-like Zn-dependent oxidoreductase